MRVREVMELAAETSPPSVPSSNVSLCVRREGEERQGSFHWQVTYKGVSKAPPGCKLVPGRSLSTLWEDRLCDRVGLSPRRRFFPPKPDDLFSPRHAHSRGQGLKKGK